MCGKKIMQVKKIYFLGFFQTIKLVFLTVLEKHTITKIIFIKINFKFVTTTECLND
jgi:hypothetical protein